MNIRILNCFILIILLVPVFVTGEVQEYIFNFNNDSNLVYDKQKIEVHNGKIRLAPTGFWTNTGVLTNDKLPKCLFQDSKGNFFYSCNHMGGPPYATYKSSNHGTNWKRIETLFNNMLEGSDGNLYAGFQYNTNSILISYDQGDTWSNTSIIASHGGAIYEDENNVLYTSVCRSRTTPTMYTTNEIYKSYDYGTNWTLIFKDGKDGIAEGHCNWIIQRKNKDLLVNFHNYSVTNGIYFSTNEGTNWSIASGSMGVKYNYGVLRINDSQLYAYGDQGLTQSMDDGLTWIKISSEPCYNIIQSDDNILYKVTETNIWKSFDNNTWIELPHLEKNGTNYQNFLGSAIIQADDGRIYVGGAFDDNHGYLFKSGNALSSEIILTCSPSVVNEWSSLSKSETLNNGQITYEYSYSSDKGESWSQWKSLDNENLKNISCEADGLDQLKIKINLIASSHNSSPEINNLKILYDNGLGNDLSRVTTAPNPFKPYVNNINYIKFFNLTPSFEIFVYSITGTEIAYIQGTTQNGQYIWNVKDNQGNVLKTGVYICYIKNNLGQKKQIKLVVIK